MAGIKLLVNRVWRALLCGLVAFPVLVLSPGAMAQTNRSEMDIDSPGLVIEASAGWDGTVDRATPIPVSFLIKNESERVIRGHLTLSDRGGGHVVTLEEIVVGPKAKQRFASIQAMPNWYECIVTLSDGERILWRRELDLSTGNEFDAKYNFALFIDRARKLHLPGGVPDTVMNAGNATTVSGEKGRPVRCLTVKPWQVPNHAGPLIVAQAMIFSESAARTDLNRAQWRAVASWMCQGGTVFVHSESREIIDRLTHSAPLGEEAPFQSGEFTVRRVGLGAIYEYPRPLFSSAGREITRLIGETTAKLKKKAGNTFVMSGYYPNQGGRANVNRILVVVFFGFYALFSGVGAFLLFRVSQRRVAAYTIIVVVGASALAGLLGGFLRFSKGDLRWLTVTQAGAGGAVQSARIDVQSAGGRSKHVAIKGPHPDLQCIEVRPRYSYYADTWQTSSYSAFTWQPNLARNEDDTYQINALTTPWGRRRLQAMAFSRDLRRMDFELKFERAVIKSDNKKRQKELPETPIGVFSLKLVNRIGFNITDSWLVIGVTRVSSMEGVLSAVANNRTSTVIGVTPVGAVEGGLIDVYQMQSLPVLSAGATYEDTFAANFHPISNDREMIKPWPGGWMVAPRLSRLGNASAWIIGHIENSPVITIDERRSDFVPREQFHLFVQEILPEDMPDPSVFIDGGGTTSGAGAVEENGTTGGSGAH